MQDVVDRSRHSLATGMTAAGQLPYGRRARAVALFEIWRESLHILSAHSAPILFFSVFGLAGATLVGALINVVLLPGVFTRNGGRAFLATGPGVVSPQLILQALIGTVAFILARGAITWIAVHAQDDRRPTARAALRAALTRWPELLAQSLVYSIFITLGVVWLTLLLRDLHLDVTNIGRITAGLGDMSRAVGIRALGAFVPDPGSPFSDLFAFVRTGLSRTAYYSWYADRNELPSTDWWIWAIGLTGAGLIVVAETLLRLRTALIMRDQAPVSYAGLADSARAGWRNFGYITGHIWLMRLAMVVIAVGFIVIPTTFAQSIIVPTVARLTSTFWPYPLSATLFTLGGALVGVVPAAFAVVFDVRLMAHLPKPIR